MTAAFRAIVARKAGDVQSVTVGELAEDELMVGDVTIAVEASTLNYKDALAITGKAPIVRRWPLVPGIDLAGRVRESSSPKFKPGDLVVANGFGLGEAHHGGLAARARVPSGWLLALGPTGLTAKQAMAIGTAGYTAALSVLALEAAGITPDRGDILVTGAAGGVGSVAVALLAKRGYRVVAATGRTAEAPYLTALGAADILDRAELNTPVKPLKSEKWAGAIDSVGSTILANVIAQTAYGGAVAACGLAQGADLPSSVMPFILRGVSLLGIDSVMAPMEKREAAYKLLGESLDMAKLSKMATTISLDQAHHVAALMLQGEVRGRTVVDLAL
jgi:acrylyl-CoA reductase (NADPH)